jgi:hypothetical protein
VFFFPIKNFFNNTKKMVEVALDSLWNSMQQNLLETEEEEEEEQGSRSVTTAGLQAYAA